MTTYVEDINSGGPQPIKFSGLGTTSLLYSLMYVRKSVLVSNARNSLEEAPQISAIEACGSFRTLSVVGPRLHWGNSSCIK
jgi:hypothetical protein